MQKLKNKLANHFGKEPKICGSVLKVTVKSLNQGDISFLNRLYYFNPETSGFTLKRSGTGITILVSS